MLIVDGTAPTSVLDAPAQAEFGQSFTLSGARSSDAPPGRIVRYVWTDVVAGTSAETADGSFRVTVNPASPLPLGRRTYRLVVVDDSGNESAPAEAQVLIVDRTAPTAVLEAPAQAEFGQSFTLSGARSSDAPPGRIVRYVWTDVTAGTTAETAQASFQVVVSPASPLTLGRRTYRLVVADDSGNESAPAEAEVEVRDTVPPTVVPPAHQVIAATEAGGHWRPFWPAGRPPMSAGRRRSAFLPRWRGQT
ncbi:MAG: hypothetical protein HZB55_11190 [Deltaproteobacteria bacterium]|nr:hypothetical protein [Deltaproteobacteria bacterium]